MDKVFYNSDFINRNDLNIKIDNRAFNFGDAFFETIKVINSRPFNFEAHFKRIELALDILYLSHNYNIEFLFDKIIQLIKINKIFYGRLKIHIIRTNVENFFSRSSSDLLITISSCKKFKVNQPISLCFYENEKKIIGNLSTIKSSNYLISILSSIYAKKKEYDNSILFNSINNIIESSNSNIFIVKNELIYTPPSSDGCVSGTMRDWIISNFIVEQKTLFKTDLLNADEVFTTNAITGITSVNRVENSVFLSSEIAENIQQKLINLSLGF